MKIVLNLLAKFLARPAVVDYLIRRAKRTPYVHITGPDGSVYMERYWLFNPYPANSSGAAKNRFPISIRLHRIMRPDGDRHLHDHPWNARTFILRGGYTEVRPLYSDPDMREFSHLETTINRCEGDTAALKFGEYHRITSVTLGGVWTLFVTGKYRGTWGFDVDGVKKPWREYLGIHE
jgi:hypothetical protein